MRVFGVAPLFIIAIYINNVESKMSVDQLRGMVSKLRPTCQKKTGVTDDLIEGTHQGAFPEDESLRCFEKCIFQSMNLFKNNKINGAGLMKQINTMVDTSIAPTLVGMAEACIPQATSEEPCEHVIQFVKCWYEQDPALYLFP